MWFDEIMDDCREGFEIACKNKKLFIPLFIKNALDMFFFILWFTVVMLIFIAHGRDLKTILNSPDNLSNLLLFLFFACLTFYLYFTLFSAIFEAGSINLYKTIVSGLEPKAQYFFQGVKKYFLKILGGIFLFHIVFIIFCIPIIIVLVIYTFTIGILTAGWGIVFLGIVVNVYFATWPVAMVADDLEPVQAIGTGIKLGRKHFWELFILVLASGMISRFLVSVFGSLIVFVGGWFISGIIEAYFKLVLLLFYMRKREEIMG
ncbi:MAG: hypothetical protein GX066_09280 [Clostridiaceae bacterium]|nr:hypothetical protein [Clostridiaceae bacterium]